MVISQYVWSNTSSNAIDYLLCKILYFAIELFSTKKHEPMKQVDSKIVNTEVNYINKKNNEIVLDLEQEPNTQMNTEDLNQTVDTIFKKIEDRLLVDFDVNSTDTISSNPEDTSGNKLIDSTNHLSNEININLEDTTNKLTDSTNHLSNELKTDELFIKLTENDQSTTKLLELAPVLEEETRELVRKFSTQIEIKPFNNDKNKNQSGTAEFGISMEDIFDTSASAKIDTPNIKEAKFTGKIKIGSDKWNLKSEFSSDKFKASFTLFKDLSIGLSDVKYEFNNINDIKFNLDFKMISFILGSRNNLLKKITIDIIKLSNALASNTKCLTSTSPQYLEFTIAIDFEKQCLTLKIKLTSAITISFSISHNILNLWNDGIYKIFKTLFDDLKQSLEIGIKNENKKTLYKTQQSNVAKYKYLTI